MTWILNDKYVLYIVKQIRLLENLVLVLTMLKNICLKCIVPISIVQVYGQNIMKIHIKRLILLTITYCLRILLKLPKFCSASDMFITHGICNFDAQIRKQLYSFTCRVDLSCNPLICSLLCTDINKYSNWTRKVLVLNTLYI